MWTDTRPSQQETPKVLFLVVMKNLDYISASLTIILRTTKKLRKICFPFEQIVAQEPKHIRVISAIR